MSFMRRRTANALRAAAMRAEPPVTEWTSAILQIEEDEKQAASKACPKCGKGLKAKGAHLHIRACKGAA